VVPRFKLAQPARLLTVAFADRERAVKFAERFRGLPPDVEAIWPWEWYEHINSWVVEFQDGRPVAMEPCLTWGGDDRWEPEEGGATYIPGE